MVFPYPLSRRLDLALDETIWADGDSAVSQWEDEGGATTNIYQSVDSESDTDYAVTQLPLISNGSKVLRFFMQNPSGTPAGGQQVYVSVRAEWVDGGFSPFGGNASMIMRIKQGTTTRHTSSSKTLTETPTTWTSFMTMTQINAVTDWDNILVETTFSADTFGVDEEVFFRCYRCKIVFAP